MRAVVQRAAGADVSVGGKVAGAIGQGLVVFLGVEEGDSEKDAAYMAEKIAGLRVFEDSEGKMNLSVKDAGGSVLAVSQFTLLGDARKGKRPSFIKAARPEQANELYREFVEMVRKQGVGTEEGVFQAEMLVRVQNDGPVTIILDSKKLF
ncbi:MAG: D-aminoacyl-tRNA deacylase [Clostridiales bacterium]|nr:D-aminoacyl-tRNA deacylase [Clostridiales bacterium]